MSHSGPCERKRLEGKVSGKGQRSWDDRLCRDHDPVDMEARVDGHWQTAKTARVVENTYPPRATTKTTKEIIS